MSVFVVKYVVGLGVGSNGRHCPPFQIDAARDEVPFWVTLVSLPKHSWRLPRDYLS